MEGEKGWRSGGEADIETRAAFGSVKEAVALFGEQILAGEIYGTRLKEGQLTPPLHMPPPLWRKETNSTPSPQSRLRSLTLELEQTKQTLTRTLQLNNILSNRIKTLTQELEHGKKEIQRLKRMRSCRLDNPEIEELKFAEQDVVTTDELEKRRLETFASSPLLARVISSVEDGDERKKEDTVFERDCSVKKTKLKKGFAPLIGWFRATRRGD